MHKSIAIIVSLFIVHCSLSVAQPWMKSIEGRQKYNFYEIQKAFYEFWKDKDSTVRGTGWKQFKRWEWFWEQRVYPTGQFPNPMQLYNETQRANNYFNKNKRDALQDYSWTQIGPTDSPGGYAGLGRLNVVRVNPNNNNIIWVGSASGGLWKSTNGGSTWTSNTDNLPTLGVTDILINPSNTNIMYIATGDGDHSDTYSVGVMKSTDGGSTWNTTGLNWETLQVRTISRLLMHPDNPDVIYSAGSNGVYKTTDGGNNWSFVLTGSFKDMEFKPGSPSTIYVSGYGIFRSTDDGANWTQLTNGLPSTDIQRIALGVTPANSNFIYALIARTNSAFKGLYRSTDSGDSWQERSTTPNILGWTNNGSDNSGQGWYDLCIAVSQTNENEIYTGGINIWKSTNGGSNWQINTMWYSSGSIPVIHADQHDLYFIPGTSTLYAGNDGGIYRTTNGGSSWQWLGSGLKITQFYRLGTSATNDYLIIAGAQDNGTKLKKSSSAWDDVIGGDGMECLIDYSNENILYGSLYYGDIRKSTNGGTSFTAIKNNINESGGWITPFVIHPTNPQTLFAGYLNVWKTTNRGSSWTKISDFGSTQKLSLLAIARSNPNVIYTGTGNRLYRSDNGGTNWTQVNMPFGTTMTSLVIHPENPQKIWAASSGYTSNTKVYVSTNGGSSWANISGNLPNIPVNTIIYQYGSPERIFVGTDVGVYYKDSTVTGWQDYNNGLANVIVKELELNDCATKIRAATYGRGIWEADVMEALLAPNVSSPSNHSKGNNIYSLYLQWTSVSGALRYSLQLSESQSFTTYIINKDSISSNIYIVTNLQYNKKYYWRIKAYSDCGSSNWSETFDFTTKLSPPLLSTPSNGASGRQINGTLGWNSVFGAVSYRVQLATDSNFTIVVIDKSNISGLNTSYSNLQFNNKYYWRVLASGEGNYSDWSDVWEFTTILDSPKLREPANLSAGVKTSGQFKWFSVAGANSYNIQLATDNQFNNIILDSININQLFLNYSNLQNNLTYFWRASASNSGSTSNWSEAWQFRTVISAPVLEYPLNKSKGIPVSDRCKWKEVDGAQSYRIQIAEDSLFNTIAYDKANINNTSTIFDTLENSKIYYWRVNARNNSGTSDWSATWYFKTQIQKPILISPIDNTKELPNDVIMLWKKVKDASNYELQISELKDFSKLTTNQSGLSDTSYLYTGLSNDKTYYWRVRGFEHNTPGEWSDIWKFTTVLTAPNLVEPINNSERINISGSLHWHKLQDASSYRVQLSVNKDFLVTTIDKSDIIDTSITFSALEFGKLYYWRVNAVTSQGTTNWSEIWKFRTELEKPKLIYPPDNSYEIPTDSNFIWSQVEGTNEYILELSEEPDFKNVIFSQNKLSDTLLPYTSLKNDFTYYWRVKDKTETSEGKWSEAQFNTLLQAPSLLLPAMDNDTVEIYDVKFIWSSIKNSENYSLNVSKDFTFSDYVINEEQLKDTIYIFSPLELSSVYYWRVRASNFRGNSNWSETGKFYTFAVSSVLINQNGITTFNRPNPFTDETEIIYTLEKAANVKMSIFNIIGNKVLERDLGMQNAGENKCSISNFQFPIKDGVLFYRISVGSETITGKMIKLSNQYYNF